MTVENFEKKEKKKQKMWLKEEKKMKKKEKKMKDNTNTFYFYFNDFWVWDWRMFFVVLFGFVKLYCWKLCWSDRHEEERHISLRK